MPEAAFTRAPFRWAPSTPKSGCCCVSGGKLILQRDGGGRWRLEGDQDLDAMLGEKVRLEGIRTDFDALEVQRVAKC